MYAVFTTVSGRKHSVGSGVVSPLSLLMMDLTAGLKAIETKHSLAWQHTRGKQLHCSCEHKCIFLARTISVINPVGVILRVG